MPTSVASLSKLTVAKLRAILRYHNCSIVGCKDQLVLRVLLLRQGRTATMLVKEEQELKELIKIIQLIFAQRFLKLSTRIYRKRTYHTTSTASFLPVPVRTHSETDLTDLFLPLLDYVALQHDQRAAQALFENKNISTR